MIANLNNVELGITKEIIHIGLSKAAESLSFFIKEKVMIQIVDIKVNSNDFNPISKKEDDGVKCLLTTNIIGEITGTSYLVFNTSEVNKIISTNFADVVFKSEDERDKMSSAILLEIDNIITASVLTQFSNILQKKMYGDVPAIDIVEKNKLNEHLNEKNKNNLNVIYINSHFITDKIDINPEFIWLMDDNFFSTVKSLVRDEKKLELIHLLTAKN